MKSIIKEEEIIMETNKVSEIVFMLDMTASMQPLAAETVIGFNNFIEEQKKVPGEAKVTLITFNSNKTEKVYNCVDLTTIQPMKQEEYRPNGMTPLLDTIGNTIKETGERLKNTDEPDRPEKLIVCIMTDGEENFSHTYDRKQVFDMVKHQKDVYKWEFVFLGANQDSFLEAGRLGVDKKDIQNYTSDSDGLKAAYTFTSAAVTQYRNQ